MKSYDPRFFFLSEGFLDTLGSIAHALWPLLTCSCTLVYPVFGPLIAATSMAGMYCITLLVPALLTAPASDSVLHGSSGACRHNAPSPAVHTLLRKSTSLLFLDHAVPCNDPLYLHLPSQFLICCIPSMQSRFESHGFVP